METITVGFGALKVLIDQFPNYEQREKAKLLKLIERYERESKKPPNLFDDDSFLQMKLEIDARIEVMIQSKGN